MSFIEFDSVYKRYTAGEVIIPAVDGVTFSVEKGEFCLIVGTSGAGKSTVLNMLGGMDTCDDGKIRVAGRLINNLSKNELIDYRRYDVRRARVVPEALPRDARRVVRDEGAHPVPGNVVVFGLAVLTRVHREEVAHADLPHVLGRLLGDVLGEYVHNALVEVELTVVDEKPRRGAGGAMIAFLHPKATGGVLLELCERK